VPFFAVMHAADAIALAVRNNALWCDATCKAHGTAGVFHDAYWVHAGAVPPYTSKLITLAATDHAAQLAAIRSVRELTPATGFSVKDAFSDLDLAPLGFHVLFRATWLWMDTGAGRGAPGALSWSVVHTPAELAAWECAFRGPNPAASVLPSVFPSSLLDEPGVHLLAGSRDESVLATAILNRTVGRLGRPTGTTAMGRPHPGWR
jgi:hypothetical protein